MKVNPRFVIFAIGLGLVLGGLFGPKVALIGVGVYCLIGAMASK